MSTAVNLRILGSGINWINLSTIIAMKLNGYRSPLGADASVSVTTMNPGVASLRGPQLVSEGLFDIGYATPAWYAALAYEGRWPFEAAQNIRAIATFPHDDRMMFVVRKDTGLTSIAEIRDRRYPLRYSIPPDDLHPAVWAADVVLKEYGFSRAAIDSWGGRALRDRPRALEDPKEKAVSDEWEAIFDEAIMTVRWENIARQYDVAFLPIEPVVLERLAARGMPAGTIRKGRFPSVTEDIQTLDFSGWFMFCRSDLPDEVSYLVAKAIDDSRSAFAERIPVAQGLTHPVDPGTYASRVPIPLHGGAETYYREKGYLS